MGLSRSSGAYMPANPAPCAKPLRLQRRPAVIEVEMGHMPDRWPNHVETVLRCSVWEGAGFDRRLIRRSYSVCKPTPKE